MESIAPTILTALLAFGALVSAAVLLIVHRASIQEFFGKEDRFPSPRWYAWLRFAWLMLWGFSLGASFGPEACHYGYSEEPSAIEEREPTEDPAVG